MKWSIKYKPKYSLSIKYLKKILTRDEFNNLMEKYVEYKLKFGKGVINKKK